MRVHSYRWAWGGPANGWSGGSDTENKKNIVLLYSKMDEMLLVLVYVLRMQYKVPGYTSMYITLVVWPS